MIIEGKKVAYITLGCKLNFSETSTIKHSLEQAGTLTVNEKENADIFIINTCSVTDIAEKKGRQLIRKITHHNPQAYIVVVGCYAQLRADEILAIEGVNLVLGAQDKFNVVHYLRHYNPHEKQMPHSCDVFKIDHFDLAYSYGDRTRCFLKIQDGCDYFCSYCTIPFARGKSRSATIEQVLEAIQKAAQKNIKEVILTGVNTGKFGQDNGQSFIELLQAIDQQEAIPRFRISSIEPNLLTNEIIEFVARSSHFMPHFHVPLQSGSNDVLKLMKRRYTRELFAEKIQKIKTDIPQAFIGVDIIAGMRGETEQFFQDTLTFIEDLNISQLHVFPYSERSGTQALTIPLIVPTSEKHHRVNSLLTLSDEKLQKFYQAFQGDIRPVLFEESNVNGSICGFTDNYIRVELPYDNSLVNQIKHIRLGGINKNNNLNGEIIK